MMFWNILVIFLFFLFFIFYYFIYFINYNKVTELLKLFNGVNIIGPDCKYYLLYPMILLWLADHEEAAILSAVYNRSCRMCLKKTDKNGNIMLRNKDQAVCDVY